MSVFWWLLAHLPWQAELVVLGAVILVVAWLIPPLRHYLWIAAMGLLVIVGGSALAQRGYKQKAAEDMQAANKALDRAADARRKQQELDRDPKNLRKPDADMRND